MAETFDPIVLESERFELTRVPRATWSRMEKAGDTPERIQLSPRRQGWRRSQLLTWIEARRVTRVRGDV